jgi:predicted DNA-binding helix-hairpin-helix protein
MARKRDPLDHWIYPAALPDGRKILLLKTLLTNACQNDCYYCPTRASAAIRHVTFAPEEMARIFVEMLRRGKVQGLFLSSGIAGGALRTMDRLLSTAEIVRNRYGFKGYLHLKIMPGAEHSQVEAAVRLADRVSLNLEAPSAPRLARIAGKKDFEDDLLGRMRWVKQLADYGLATPAGQTTQFVVGAADESDQELLTTTDGLYRQVGLRRAYFSAFQPVRGTPLEDHPPTPVLREHRLYQADFLFRQYGFQPEELIFDRQGHLPLSTDPKLLWAQHHPEWFPLEVNSASREQLLRIPGIGPRAAGRLVTMRREGRLRSLEVLKAAGAVMTRAAPYVLLDGRAGAPRQMALWENGLSNS